MEPVITQHFASNWSVMMTSSDNVHRSDTLVTDVRYVTPRYLSELRQISKHDLVALSHRYRYNMKLYGYDLDVDTLMTSCRIETADGHVCC